MGEAEARGPSALRGAQHLRHATVRGDSLAERRFLLVKWTSEEHLMFAIAFALKKVYSWLSEGTERGGPDRHRENDP
jgi:hypothetical protein